MATPKPFERDVSSKYGAPMGRRSNKPEEFKGAKVRVCRVRFYDGDYDKGGAYWGSGTPLYCAYGENATEQIAYYFRAANREEALTRVKQLQEGI